MNNLSSFGQLGLCSILLIAAVSIQMALFTVSLPTNGARETIMPAHFIEFIKRQDERPDVQAKLSESRSMAGPVKEISMGREIENEALERHDGGHLVYSALDPPSAEIVVSHPLQVARMLEKLFKDIVWGAFVARLSNTKSSSSQVVLASLRAELQKDRLFSR